MAKVNSKIWPRRIYEHVLITGLRTFNTNIHENWTNRWSRVDGEALRASVGRGRRDLRQSGSRRGYERGKLRRTRDVRWWTSASRGSPRRSGRSPGWGMRCRRARAWSMLQLCKNTEYSWGSIPQDAPGLQLTILWVIRMRQKHPTILLGHVKQGSWGKFRLEVWGWWRCFCELFVAISGHEASSKPFLRNPDVKLG